MTGEQNICHDQSSAAGSKDCDEVSADSINIEQPLEMVENATLDVDQVAAQYTGLARLQRLVFIARCCPALRMEALKLAEKFVLQTHDTTLATTIRDMMPKPCAEEEPESAPGGQEASETSLSEEWIERTKTEVEQELKVLMKQRRELMSKKGSNISKNIRQVTVQMATLYQDSGDLQNASRSLHSACCYCVTFATQIQVLLFAIRVYVHMKSWDGVLSSVQKAQTLVDAVEKTECSADEKKQVQSEINCASGLVLLAATDYRAAAQAFLRIRFDFCDFPQMLSISGVTVCTVLCALTTFERTELQSRLLSSCQFKKFLELEPKWCEVVQLFTRGMYSQSLKKLQELRDNVLLDLHLHAHVHTIFPLIRKRALCQYMDPYLSADMNKMALEFNTPVETLEEEFADMIMRDQISARIDSQNKALYFKKVDQRSIIFEQALAAGKDYLRASKALLLRAAVLKSEIIVKAKRSLPKLGDEPADPNWSSDSSDEESNDDDYAHYQQSYRLDDQLKKKRG